MDSGGKGSVPQVSPKRISDVLVNGVLERRDSGGRPLPPQSHPGVAVVHGFSEDEHMDWKRWTPRVGDVVLVELADKNCLWPGKVSQTIPSQCRVCACTILGANLRAQCVISLLPCTADPVEQIVDKRSFFQGRTIPRGNHFFAIRIYNKDISP